MGGAQTLKAMPLPISLQLAEAAVDGDFGARQHVSSDILGRRLKGFGIWSGDDPFAPSGLNSYDSYLKGKRVAACLALNGLRGKDYVPAEL